MSREEVLEMLTNGRIRTEAYLKRQDLNPEWRALHEHHLELLKLRLAEFGVA